ncbi:group 1 glycosyl transferase [Telmatospirillum siberiense]|uniref:Group 1 glycosyl transferase n=2 Tax=Telmatospirillum siberiense TaxID=382514 RepID=A0A2N3PT09_9PROT|nr:group 1 glycosyl transferase [Telmatospirillum siberiense]
MLLRLVNQGADGIRHTVISLQDEGAYGAAMKAAGITVHCLRMRRGLPLPPALWRLVALLRREHPDILQTWLYHADLMGLIAGRLVGVPRIIWSIRCSSMEMASYRRSSGLVRWVLAKLSPFPDLVLANSHAGIADHRTLGYRPRAWGYIPNGFDLKEWRPDPAAKERLRARLGLPSDHLLVGLVARFDPQKDHQTFMTAAAEVAEERPDVAFLLVGRGVEPGRPPFSLARGKAPLAGRLHFMEESKDVPQLMPGLDLLALSSAWGEGFPNVIGEAMACAVPCVVTNVGDAAAIVGDTGLSVPVGDASGLARAMLNLLSLDEGARSRLGETARDRVSHHYSIQHVVDEYSRLYHHMIHLTDGKIPCAV